MASRVHMILDPDKIKEFASESKTIPEFLSKCGYKSFSNRLLKVMKENIIDVSHLEKDKKRMHVPISEAKFQEIIQRNSIWSNVLKEIGYPPNSAIYREELEKKAFDMNIDVSHLTSGKRLFYSDDEIFIEKCFKVSGETLSKRLKKKLDLSHECAICNRKNHNPLWLDEPVDIPLQIDHINGNHFDNRVENLRLICPTCHSATDTYTGKNRHRRAHALIQRFADNDDISTFQGRRNNERKETEKYTPKYELRELCVKDSWFLSGPDLVYRLKRELQWEHKCSGCSETEWQNSKNEVIPIPLQLDHINGIHNDNRIENLRLLCATCHTMTDTFTGKNVGNTGDGPIKRETPMCKRCNSMTVSAKGLMCVSCARLCSRKMERPSYEQLITDIKETNYVQTGKKYGVCDNTIRSWIVAYEKEQTIKTETEN